MTDKQRDAFLASIAMRDRGTKQRGPSVAKVQELIDASIDAIPEVAASTGGVSDGDKGDITVSGSGATWTVDNDVVTYAKMQNVSAASRLVGRGDSGAGDPQEITLGTNLSITGTTINAAGGAADGLGPDGDKGDVTVGGTGTTLTIDANAVTFAKMQAVSANVLLGNDAAGTAVEEIACTAAGRAILDDADAAAQRTTLSLGNVDNTSDANKPVSTATQTALDLKQPLDTQLTSLAALSYAGNGSKYVRINAGATDFEVVTLAGGGDMIGANNLSDVTNAATARTNLGVAIGTNVQAFDAQLTSIAALAYAGNASKVVRVNAGETDFELATPSGGGPTKISGNTGAFGGDTTWETLTADSADVTSTTQTTVMTVTGLGAGTYRVKGLLVYQTAATTTGIGITLNHTGTVTRFVSNWYQVTTGGAASTGIADQVTAVAAGQLVEGKAERAKDTRSSFTVGVDTQNADELAQLEAVIIVTLTGSLELKIATEIAASAVRLMAGSTLEVHKLV